MTAKIVQPLPGLLPDHLVGRVRPLNRPPVNKTGAFVLYWMHHAVRDHENPALDAALWSADRLRLPVLVYQGLGGLHCHNNDRHHTFILEGARDVAAALARRGISYAFHLARSPDAKTPLSTLVERAALTVTEDFPAPPFKRWLHRLAAASPTALWAVDTACILPMQSIPRPFERAFRFRQATWDAFVRQMSQPYPPFDGAIRTFTGDLEFDPLPLADADIAACCAACRIDHSVGPVAHTPGGTRAGYDRWSRFKQNGLKAYDRTRNDAAVAFPAGVSRISAYLHHGHVSPFRIVREAAQRSGKGPAKYLDEILIWRELAHNFCFYCPDPGRFDALPSWARTTLVAARRDPRPALFSLEALARAQTGDPLWDAAQQSLLIHGELHNNLRMTWGKALLQWTRTPQAALQTMIALNHRFALDGSDPNSYGGILWCLGRFDRPFPPSRPVIGTLRPRSTRSHAARLDLKRYQHRVMRPAAGKSHRVGVIGAGVSGLIAARTLADHGHQVEVFEKSRGLGGRLATRRTPSGAFDHGAQYFTARDPRFRRWVASWRHVGRVGRWNGRIGVLRQGAFVPEAGRHARYVGIPGMSALAGHLAADLNIRCNTRIASIQHASSGTVLIDSGGVRLGRFDVLILTAPPEQSAGLLRGLSPLADQLRSVGTTPCWAVMLAVDAPLASAFDGAFVQDPILAWVARNSSKPGRDGGSRWVLHATADWSAKQIELSADAVIAQLCASFSAALGTPLLEPVFAAAHRWRYARAPQPLRSGCLWDPRSKIGVCGDWCHGSRIEGAYLSGSAVAGRVLSM